MYCKVVLLIHTYLYSHLHDGKSSPDSIDFCLITVYTYIYTWWDFICTVAFKLKTFEVGSMHGKILKEQILVNERPQNMGSYTVTWSITYWPHVFQEFSWKFDKWVKITIANTLPLQYLPAQWSLLCFWKDCFLNLTANFFKFRHSKITCHMVYLVVVVFDGLSLDSVNEWLLELLVSEYAEPLKSPLFIWSFVIHWHFELLYDNYVQWKLEIGVCTGCVKVGYASALVYIYL